MYPEQVLELFVRGMIAHPRGDLDGAERYFRRALALAEEHDLARFNARILRRLSLVALGRGDDEQSRALREEALAAARGTDDLIEQLLVSDLAWKAVVDGSYELAVQLGTDALASPFLDRANDAALGHTLAVALLGLGRAREAEQVAAVGLGQASAQRNLTETAVLLDAVGGAAAYLGDDMRAARLTAAGERLLGESGIAEAELQAAHASLREHGRRRPRARGRSVGRRRRAPQGGSTPNAAVDSPARASKRRPRSRARSRRPKRGDLGARG